MNSLTFTRNSFSPTQGQWWNDCCNPHHERRVSLVASCMGFFLWTSDFRNAKTGQIIASKFFCTKPNSDDPLSWFGDTDSRQRWMEEQWQKQAV